MIKYKMIVRNEQAEFTSLINRHIEEGWMALGSMSMVFNGHHTYYGQALIKNNDNDIQVRT